MKKAKKYLNQNQQKSLTPLTPVDEAWDKMASLLDSEMPVSKKESKKRAFAINFSQFTISVVAAIILVGGATLITLRTIENNKEIHTAKDTIKHPEHDSLANKTVHIEDPDISTETDVQPINNTNRKINKEAILQLHQNNRQTSLLSAITKTQASQKALPAEKTDLSTAVADSSNLRVNRPNVLANTIDTHIQAVYADSIKPDNSLKSIILPVNKQVDKAELKTKTNLNDSLVVKRNSSIKKLSTKKKVKTENRVSSYPGRNRLFAGLPGKKNGLLPAKKGVSNYPKTNHLFVGLSGYNGLLFSKNAGKDIYSYGEMLTIGIHNTKYNLTVETGIGFQSLEYHVPYSRTLYTYQSTGIYDSTITVSSYKYSRYNIVIPFFITKEIYHRDNIFLDIKAGINTSVFLSKQRLFNQLPADIQLIEDLYPISSLNFSFALSPQFRWDINDKFSFNINAGGEFYLNSLYRNYSLKPIGINLSAGIHYFF